MRITTEMRIARAIVGTVFTIGMIIFLGLLGSKMMNCALEIQEKQAERIENMWEYERDNWK